MNSPVCPPAPADKATAIVSAFPQLQNKPEFAKLIRSFWILKRQSRHGVALIRRLQVRPLQLRCMPTALPVLVSGSPGGRGEILTPPSPGRLHAVPQVKQTQSKAAAEKASEKTTITAFRQVCLSVSLIALSPTLSHFSLPLLFCSILPHFC